MNNKKSFAGVNSKIVGAQLNSTMVPGRSTKKASSLKNKSTMAPGRSTKKASSLKTKNTIAATRGEEGLWKGFDPYSHLFRDTTPPDDNSSKDQGLGKRGNQWTEIVSWEPRAFICHNLLSKEECRHLKESAKPYMTPSTVLNVKTGQSYYSSMTVMTLQLAEHGGKLEVLRYEVGQKNLPHYDTSVDGLEIKSSNPVIATFLMYLSDVEEGGETIFPSAKGNISWVPWWNELSESDKKELSVKPKMGDALLFGP